MKVVLGGSRNLNTVPPVVQTQLREWFDQGEEFLIGDSSGADAVLQRLLADWACTRVTVYTSVPTVRVNVGNWRVEHVDSGLTSKSHAMHTAKDRVMTRAADTGLMLWDGESIGSVANVLDLLNRQCPALLFDVPREHVWRLEPATGESELRGHAQSAVEEAMRRLQQYDRRKERQATQVTQPPQDLMFDL